MLNNIRWTSNKISNYLKLIKPLVYRRMHPIAPFRYYQMESPLVKPLVESDLDVSDWTLINPSDYWGAPRTDFVLRSSFQVPVDWDKDKPTALYLPLGEAGDFSHPEALAYIDAIPYASCDRHHQEIILPPKCLDGAEYLLALHGWTGIMDDVWGGVKAEKLWMRPCYVVQIDQHTRDLLSLARVSLEIADHLDDNNPTKWHLYNALDEAFKVLDTREPLGEAFYTSVPGSYEVLSRSVHSAGSSLDVDIIAAGHAHIDVAWLWTLGQTRRKAGRTFHNVIRLMERFPEFHFTQSQPQLYEFIRQDYPELFKEIQQRVKDGQWEPIGGMWVEADCNLTGAESMARQLLLGRTFFRDHFGENAESPVLWLPDVFGYSWNLPQLIKEAGLEYFFTIKIDWNQYNHLPYQTFWWQGLDGTRVLTHFSSTPASSEDSTSAATYNAEATPRQVLGTWVDFQQKDNAETGKTLPLLMSFGYGDGGGGPNLEMVENIREMSDFSGSPRIRFGTVKEFFSELEDKVGERLPVWDGDLYLELHRGTYTTQSRNKRANRKSEFLLHDAEFLSSLAGIVNPQFTYPHQGLHQAWQTVCLNQFHDIIPGSSIAEVYKESLEQYAGVRSAGEEICNRAIKAIAAKIQGDLLVINPTSFSQNGVVLMNGELPDGFTVVHQDGTQAVVQPIENGCLFSLGILPPYSVAPFFIKRAGELADPLREIVSATRGALENGFLRVEINEAGDITRIWDKVNQREVLPVSTIANQFQAFEDRPKNWDAWDIDIFYDDKMWLADPARSIRVVESGPLRGVVEIERKMLNSEIKQRISLAHNSSRLDFDTIVEWQERHILLKVAFPVDVLSPEATYEIQWGNIQRPTHRNTSWDWAKFESVAHKWVDLSEGGYGISLLNDCKYGHDVHGNVMRLSLLRSPTSPDIDADQGEQRFMYSLLPHAERWGEETVKNAYAINDPVRVWKNTEDGRINPTNDQNVQHIEPVCFARVDQPNVIIETIKQAEDREGYIVRLYENQRRRGEVILYTTFSLVAVWRTNLLEENKETLEVIPHGVKFSIKPYQIITLRLLPDKDDFGFS